VGRGNGEGSQAPASPGVTAARSDRAPRGRPLIAAKRGPRRGQPARRGDTSPSGGDGPGHRGLARLEPGRGSVRDLPFPAVRGGTGGRRGGERGGEPRGTAQVRRQRGHRGAGLERGRRRAPRSGRPRVGPRDRPHAGCQGPSCSARAVRAIAEPGRRLDRGGAQRSRGGVGQRRDPRRGGQESSTVLRRNPGTHLVNGARQGRPARRDARRAHEPTPQRHGRRPICSGGHGGAAGALVRRAPAGVRGHRDQRGHTFL
jgi:hypothetical protein